MRDSLQRLWALTWIIFLDGLRRQAILGLIVLALGLELSGFIFMDFIGHDIGRASTDFLFSIAWIVGAFFIFFHAVQVISWDEENGVIYALLSRAISRFEYVIGVFLGLSLLLLFLQLIVGSVALVSLYLIQSQLDSTYFPLLVPSHFILAWLGLFMMQWLLISVVVLFSGLVRGGFPVFILSLSFYLICSGLPIVRAHLLRQADMGIDTGLSPQLFQFLSAVFPDFSRLDFKNSVVSLDIGLDISDLLLSFSMSSLYIVMAILLACKLYSRRDLY
jgi:ABC-type transport system involved in multi-copper enzyme maturation permease subunit